MALLATASTVYFSIKFLLVTLLLPPRPICEITASISSDQVGYVQKLVLFLLILLPKLFDFFTFQK